MLYLLPRCPYDPFLDLLDVVLPNLLIVAIYDLVSDVVAHLHLDCRDDILHLLEVLVLARATTHLGHYHPGLLPFKVSPQHSSVLVLDLLFLPEVYLDEFN